MTSIRIAIQILSNTFEDPGKLFRACNIKFFSSFRRIFKYNGCLEFLSFYTLKMSNKLIYYNELYIIGQFNIAFFFCNYVVTRFSSLIFLFHQKVLGSFNIILKISKFCFTAIHSHVISNLFNFYEIQSSRDFFTYVQINQNILQLFFLRSLFLLLTLSCFFIVTNFN